MHITLAAIGRFAANDPAKALYGEYARRLPWKLDLKELEIKKQWPAEKRKIEEATLLLAACGKAERLIALDEHGKTLSSREFADTIGAWQNQGVSSLGFIIGGADGLDAGLLAKAHVKLSFGRATWPHMLVRAMLAEQLYRAHTLLTNHPYHRD